MSRFLPVLAVLESFAMMATVWRFSTIDFDLNSQARIAWFAVAILLATSAVALFVVRTRLAGRHGALPSEVDELEKQAFAFSSALIALAFLVGVAGLPLFERLLG